MNWMKLNSWIWTFKPKHFTNVFPTYKQKMLIWQPPRSKVFLFFLTLCVFDFECQLSGKRTYWTPCVCTLTGSDSWHTFSKVKADWRSPCSAPLHMTWFPINTCHTSCRNSAAPRTCRANATWIDGGTANRWDLGCKEESDLPCFNVMQRPN